MKDLKDTICSLSTAPGRAGIAVVRVSGPECINIVRGSFSPERTTEEYPSRRAILGQIRDTRTGRAIDQGILTYFPAPNSYTGEDLAEISLHGSPVLVAGLLESLCSVGARLAEPGEFTLRAFVHGKIDLTQAEAVRDIIESSTLYQAQVASRQRSGQLSAQMEPVKRALIDIIVNLETAVEFIEEDTDPESRQQIAAKIEHTVDELTRWIESFRQGRIIREGFSLAIIGRPNVGKSSVFNALLAQERSIVTEIPGTTRDLVSEVTNLAGIPTRLLDTAGVCATDDRIESIGVERSLRAMADADAVVLVIDRSLPCSKGDAELRALLKDGTGVIAFNKSDLPPAWQPGDMTSFSESFPFVEVSAKTGDCIQGLRQAILRHLLGDSGPDRDGILITNIRHCNCLEAANEKLKRASEALKQGVSEEYVLVDLHAALKELGAVTGETSTEDLLSEIFSRFCIGK